MPGEGFPAAISKATGIPFPKAKIAVDIALVLSAVFAGFCFFGRWMWEIVGPGTLFAMIFVGFVVKLLHPRLAWFDNLLHLHPGFHRYLFGMARHLYRRRRYDLSDSPAESDESGSDASGVPGSDM